MGRVGRISLGVLGVLVVGFIGFFGYIWFSGGSGEPSREAEAEEVAPEQPDSVVYAAVPGESEARFIIEEVLRGEPNTVVGVTDQVDGSVALQFQPPDVQIGQFVINVRSVKTDDEVRDRTIRTLILESNKDEFEFSTFEPTSIAGVPDSIAVGDTLDLEVTGDLTVRDITREVLFDMTLEVSSLEEIRGTANTTITWDNFDITIPYVGGDSIVASVGDEVRLELDFLARANGE
jgi:polyisoprenoid-binding protein YceI